MKPAVIVSLMAVVGRAIAGNCVPGQVYPYLLLLDLDPAYAAEMEACFLRTHSLPYAKAQIAEWLYQCLPSGRFNPATKFGLVSCAPPCHTLEVGALGANLVCLDLNLNLGGLQL
ncbi:hypothetical protein C8F01DRAFT_1089475 [Mycena amicta]|nr:hypothetical protein C8F01DRAFT_1089475 [Mycena amicta]